jgi:hypothetical protein
MLTSPACKSRSARAILAGHARGATDRLTETDVVPTPPLLREHGDELVAAAARTRAIRDLERFSTPTSTRRSLPARNSFRAGTHGAKSYSGVSCDVTKIVVAGFSS